MQTTVPPVPHRDASCADAAVPARAERRAALFPRATPTPRPTARGSPGRRGPRSSSRPPGPADLTPGGHARRFRRPGAPGRGYGGDMSTPHEQAAALRARQRPLKDRYRAARGTALQVSTASARVLPDGVAAEVPQWAGTARAGLHPSTGGDGSEACSADMLLEALAGCAGVTLRRAAVCRERREAHLSSVCHTRARAR